MTEMGLPGGKGRRYLRIFWYIPLYYIVFEFFSLSFSYFYTVTSNAAVTQLIAAFFKVRTVALVLSILLILMDHKVTIDSMIVLALIWGAYGLTAVFYPKNMNYLSPMFSYLLYGSACFPILRAKPFSFERLKDTLIAFSRVLCVLVSISLLLVQNRDYYIARQYMTFSNALALPTAFCLYSFLYQKNKWDWIPSLIGITFILLFGARGAFVLLAAFIGISLWKQYGRKKKYLMILVAVVLICMIAASVFLMAAGFTGGLANLTMQSFTSGTSSRTLQLLFSGNLLKQSRVQIWLYLMKASLEDGLLGGGMAADRVYLPYAFQNSDANYAHNLLIEWMVSFGIFGIALFVWLCIKLWRKYSLVEEQEERGFVLLLLIVLFAQYMISRTWITDAGFFCMLGMIGNIKHNHGLAWP